MNIFYIFRVCWVLFVKEIQSGKEPHTRMYGTLGLNKSLIKPESIYSGIVNDERGYDYRHPLKSTHKEHHDFANNFTKLAKLKLLQSLSDKFSSISPSHISSFTPEYLQTYMRDMDETVYINYRMAIGESSVLNEFSCSHIPICKIEKSGGVAEGHDVGFLLYSGERPQGVRRNIVPPRGMVEPTDTQRPTYSIRNIKKGGLLDDFTADI